MTSGAALRSPLVLGPIFRILPLSLINPFSLILFHFAENLLTFVDFYHLRSRMVIKRRFWYKNIWVHAEDPVITNDGLHCRLCAHHYNFA